MRTLALLLFLAGSMIVIGAATKVSLFQIAATAAQSPGAVFVVMTDGSVKQVQLGTGFLLAGGSGSPLVLQAGGSMPFTHLETPAGTVDGTNAAFTLQAAPAMAAGLLLSRNGLILTSGVDYSIVGSAITFLPGSIPQPGDVITARY
jgi:hypothetical protein